MNQEENLLQNLSAIAQRFKDIHNDAVIAYTPQVQELCAKKATENEVGLMLDWLLMYAGDERMLKLYKQVCRTYWKIYPESIAFYIMEYRKEYDRESLIGTEYEYLLHEDEMDKKQILNYFVQFENVRRVAQIGGTIHKGCAFIVIVGV